MRTSVLSAAVVGLLLLSTPVFAADTSLKSQISQSSLNQKYPGIISAYREAKLAFRVGGPLVEVAVKPGDKVEKDQLLMQIDPRDFEDNIKVLEAQLAGAEAQRDAAKRDFDRARTLFDQHVNAAADFDRARSMFDSAFATVQSLKAQLRIARHRLGDTSLLAPYAGVITKRNVENYEMVESGSKVLEIQDTSVLKVEIKMPENELGKTQIQGGRKVEVEFPAIPGRSLTAELVEWNVSADPVTRTYALRFSFPAPEDYYVLPGMTAEVRLINGNH